MATDQHSPVVWTPKGPRLVLADGSVARLVVTENGDVKEFVGVNQGSALYGEDEGDPAKTEIAFVDDPEAEKYGVVQEVLDEYDV